MTHSKLVSTATKDKSDPYYYYRNIENLELIGEEGVVITGSIKCISGHASGSGTNPVTGDEISDHTNSYYGYIIIDGLTIKGFTFNGGTINLTSSLKDATTTNVNISDCKFERTDKTLQAIKIGYDCENISNITVSNCVVTGYNQGFYGQNINKLTITGCTVSGTGHNALAVQSSNGTFKGEITITGNTISATGDRAIRLGDGSGATIKIDNNTFTGTVYDSDNQILACTSLSGDSSHSFSGNTLDGKTMILSGTPTQDEKLVYEGKEMEDGNVKNCWVISLNAL